MIHAINWANAHLHDGALYDSHRLRHAIFVRRTGYDVPTYEDAEYDQFDTPAAVYLVHRGGSGRVDGVARLVPTTRPYMLRELWPDLVEGPLPESPSVWEGTRFGIDAGLAVDERRNVSRRLVAACQEFGLDRGLEAMLVLMPPLILRSVIRSAGCEIEPLGPVKRKGGIPVQAARVPISEAALRAVRAVGGIRGDVLAPPPAARAA
ncbi:acyl-homoserine-lactone synthase [Caenispirillum salinarum]|uniref:acyl-homoserine-lactone synthase n=1 Tax=Caenispirillum salinarum TaxID=859058 RepID=UPI00384A8C8E